MNIIPKAKPISESGIKVGTILVLAIIAIALLLRFVQWITPVKATPLLTNTEGLIRLDSVDQISSYTQTPVTIPSEIFGSVLHVVGVYMEENPIFPQGTVDLVFARQGYRFVSITFQPSTNLEFELERYQTRPMETVKLSKDIDGTLVRIRDYSTCKKTTEDSIGICQIRNALLFDYQGLLIMLSGDGQHASDGELIQMAKSIIVE